MDSGGWWSRNPAHLKPSISEASEVDRYEFVELELVRHPEDENQFNHFYIGSKDDYDYITVRNNRYKISSDQLNLDHNFALTEDKSKWIPLRIHFSHVKDGTN